MIKTKMNQVSYIFVKHKQILSQSLDKELWYYFNISLPLATLCCGAIFVVHLKVPLQVELTIGAAAVKRLVSHDTSS